MGAVSRDKGLSLIVCEQAADSSNSFLDTLELQSYNKNNHRNDISGLRRSAYVKIWS